MGVRMSQPYLISWSAGAEVKKVRKSIISLERRALAIIIGQDFNFDVLQWNNVLAVVLFVANDNGAVDENVIEEEHLPRLQLLPAHLLEDALAHQHPARRVGQRHAGHAEAAFDVGNPADVLIGANCSVGSKQTNKWSATVLHCDALINLPKRSTIVIMCG